MTTMMPSELAEACADRIVKPGMWIHNGLLSAGDASCALGTIDRFVGSHMIGTGRLVQNALNDAVKPIIGNSNNIGLYDIAYYNDHWASNAQEVADKFIEVAKKFRNEGQ